MDFTRTDIYEHLDISLFQIKCIIDLFEIKAEPNELFISTSVDDIESYTSTNMRKG